MDIKSLYQRVILDHSSNPQNCLDPDDKSDYLKKRGFNPTCGDDVVILIKIENDILSTVKQYSNGCSICKASTSILTTILNGKSVKDAKYICINFINMILDKEYDAEVITQEMHAFDGVKGLTARIKCTLLSWKTAFEIIEEYENSSNETDPGL